MSAIHHNRVERQKRLVNALPSAGTPLSQCPDGAALLAIFDRDALYSDTSDQARRRALQRDLEMLVKEGHIEAANPGRKPLRYRRCEANLIDDSLIWEFTVRQIADLVQTLVPQRQFDALWQRLLNSIDEGPVLDASRLRCISDTFRLRTTELKAEVLTPVITALAKNHALEVTYKSKGKQSARALIHPQALVQRGPISYLFALKEEETEPVRLYALHRMIRASVSTDTPARRAEGFDLDSAIATGRVDFGQGKMITLELRVRGYLTELLEDCPLSTDQTINIEPNESGFDLHVSAQVPSTGQLLRWLLGAGDNLEVLAPPELRQTVMTQAEKMAGIYAETPANANG